MQKRNVYFGLTLTVASILVLFFQNCGPSNNGQAPIADGKIVVDDFLIRETDCSSETCKVTVAKSNKKSEDHQVSLLDEDIPLEFYRQDSESGAYVKCVFVNRRDDIRFEYLCAK